ncbi:MAG: toll/interleukin-1 receptor domain-containing protein [Eubacteriales bacterium]|nr:toll/interleukin-1 receptor domain-containing protein [Eubacteriales bacterium]
MTTYKYDAFISYRHTELDEDVAEAVHKKLEHYHIPRRLQKQVGKKRIRRIFRDREELPLSADLSESIREALDQSEFLIVICSKAACESRWVCQEITYFIEKNGYDRVLTVLVNDEPKEAFPDILRFHKEKRIDADGNEQEICVEVEPLAADVRAEDKNSRKKKLDMEMLRLIAPMLNCSYDELRRRHREYRLKRAAAISGVLFLGALGLAGYGTYKNMQINAANKAKLFSQSRYLSALALEALQEGQPLQARELALQSVSAGNANLPVTTDAQYVLSQILHTYIREQDNVLSVTAAYECSDSRNGYESAAFTDSERELLFAKASECIDIWDLSSNKRIETITGGSGKQIIHCGRELLLPEEQLLCFAERDRIRVYDYGKHTFLWDQEGSDISKLILLPGKKELISLEKKRIRRFAVRTGDCMQEITFDDETYSIAGDSVTVSSDEERIAFDITGKNPEIDYDFSLDLIEAEWKYQEEERQKCQDGIGILRMDTDTLQILEPGMGLLDHLQFTPDGQILAVSDNGLRAVYADQYTYHMEQANTAEIALLSAENAEQQWRQTVEYGAFDSCINCQLADDTSVLLTAGNQCLRLELKNGTVLQRWEADGALCFLYNVSGQGFHAVCENGKMYQGEFGSTAWTAVELFEGGISRMSQEAGSFWVLYPAKGNRKAYLAGYSFVGDDTFVPVNASEALQIKARMKTSARLEDPSLTVEENGTVKKYSSDGSGELLWSIDLPVRNIYKPVWYAAGEDRVVLIDGIGDAYELDVSEKNHGLAAVVRHAVYYDAEEDRYYLGNYNAEEIYGWFHRYSAEELAERAYAIDQSYGSGKE